MDSIPDNRPVTSAGIEDRRGASAYEVRNSYSSRRVGNLLAVNASGEKNRTAWLVARGVTGTVFLLWATSIATNLVMLWNSTVNARLVLFPIALMVLSGSYFLFMQRHIPDPRGNPKNTWWIALVMVPVVALLGLSLMGWDNVLNGKVVMTGDRYQDSALFALSASLVMPAAAGIVEEVAVGGYLQCTLAIHLSALRAQLIAGAVFLAMHGSQLLETKRLILLVTLAGVCGYLTSRSRRMGPAVFVHSTVNFGMAAVVLLSR